MIYTCTSTYFNVRRYDRSGVLAENKWYVARPTTQPHDQQKRSPGNGTPSLISRR